MDRAGSGDRVRAAVPWLVGGAVLLASYLLGMPACPARRLLGLPCPGCGLTRATASFIQLDLPGAFAAHPLVFVVVPLLGWLAAHTVFGGARVPAPPAWLWVAAAALMVGVWLVRLAGAFGGHPDL
jgi:hypothetical protein